MKKFYIYDDTNITLNDWLSHLPTLHRGYLDEDLYKNFKNHYMRTLQPEQAHIFIIGIPMVKSYVRDNINHIENMKKAILTVANNKYFTRNNGKDHLILADDWKLSAWAEVFKNSTIKELYQNKFENVTSTRYEVFKKSKWNNPTHDISINLPQSFFNTEWELTKYNIIVPYKPYLGTIITANYENWVSRKLLLFSHTQDHIYAHGATEIRKKATFAFQKLTNCSIGHDIPFNKWYNNIINSKYVLVVRGDTPGSHSFINAIAAGCIPIIISDAFQYCSTPFNDVIKLEDYSITISEKSFLENPSALLNIIEELSEDCIKNKLNVLFEVQKIMLLDHPESKVCSLILDSVYKSIKY